MRKKITQERIIDATLEIVEEKGIAGVTIKNTAIQLGIKPPSLYNHVENLEDLLDIAANKSMRNLYEKLLTASIGLEKKEALWAIAQEYRNFAKNNPGQYELAQKVNVWNSEETKQISEQIVAIFLKILQKYTLSEEEAIHFIRVLRSYLHGFTLLEINEGFGLPQELEKSFTIGLELVLTNLESRSNQDGQWE
ncbi:MULTISPECIES: TetR/AcrR family transcriptional regulator [Oceanobacillus]|uniref:TetR/AcrR family transcriptional regulator n=1 Tax=Oceanobacillus aidingensis TaxID=645964 RepID=A0ABV9K351_9BACI|nr:TetR/AcrR family transcriptional regulator [Oceanobacillus oncorhynchi]MDM8100525.1 WHG domain-containing protein [Oceanobacillus oncorhynchi]